MIGGQKNTEKTYRATLLDSYSSLKDFSTDRKKYFRKYIQGEKVKDEENKAMTMGSLVECLLMEREKFDKKFKMSEVESISTGLKLKFVNALVKHTLDCVDEETGELTKNFEQVSLLAYPDSGFKIPYERVIKEFAGSDDEAYFKELLEVAMYDLTVVTVQDVTNAENIVNELTNNSVTSAIVNQINTERYEVIDQLQVEGFEIDDHVLKCMLDKTIIDHHEKIIQPYDLKCMWAVEAFYEEGYLYRRYYIQGYVYDKGLLHYVDQREDLEGYTILPMKFIVSDSINYYNPLIYSLNANHLKEAYEGFTYRGRTYPGVKEIIDDLKFCLEFNVWNLSKKNYLSKGIVELQNA